jgi:hypothetical protein
LCMTALRVHSSGPSVAKEARVVRFGANRRSRPQISQCVCQGGSGHDE